MRKTILPTLLGTLLLSMLVMTVYSDYPLDIKELNIKNIYADDAVDCNEFDYYSFYVPKDFKVQRFYLSFRFTQYDDSGDKPEIAIYFKLNQVANITDYDAKTLSPDIPIAFDKIPADSTCFITVAGVGMCKQGLETTNHYYFKGYLDKQGPIPDWALFTIVIGAALLICVSLVGCVSAYRYYSYKRRHYEVLE